LMASLGADPGRLEIPILQFVHIVEGGARASMSKRRGEFITLDDLVAEIGVDATRYFMLSRSNDSTIDLALDLAREHSAENPVYALELAQVFTAFYRDCQVVGAQPAEVETLRLQLCVATQRTIARALDLLGVSAPDHM